MNNTYPEYRLILYFVLIIQMLHGIVYCLFYVFELSLIFSFIYAYIWFYFYPFMFNDHDFNTDSYYYYDDC